MGIARETDREVELTCREKGLYTAYPYLPRAPVDDELPDLQNVGRARHCTPENRMDPCDELRIQLALRDIVGAPLERTDALERIGAGTRQHDHGDVPVPAPPRLALTEPRAQLGLTGEDDVRPLPLREVESLRAPARLENVEPVRAQVALEIPGPIGSGVGEEEGRTHPSTVGPHLDRTPDVLFDECVTIVPQLSAAARGRLG